MIVEFIDGHRDEFGVEPICKALQVATSSYYSAKSRPPSARAMRDAVMLPVLMAMWVANWKVYGAQKLWKAARRAGHDVGRDQIVRLMRELGIEGTRFLRSSRMPGIEGAGTDRLLSLLRATGADHYISGPSARAYIDEDRVREAGVTLEYMEYDYPEYEQLHPPFDPRVSILDLLLMKGPEAGEYVWGRFAEGKR